MRETGNRYYRLTLMGVLSAIIIIQNFVPFLGYIPLQPFNPTIIPITVIIGAIFLGGLSGGVLGLVWGVVCLFRAFVLPTSPIDPIVFTNPLVSVLPRILVGLAAGGLYALLKKTKLPRVASYAFCGVAGAMVNTILVLSAIYLLYKVPYAAFYEMSAEELLPALLAVVLSNGIAEAVVAGVLTPLIAAPLQRLRKGTA